MASKPTSHQKSRLFLSTGSNYSTCWKPAKTLAWLYVAYAKAKAERDGGGQSIKVRKHVPVVELLPVKSDHDVLVVRCAEFGAYTRHGKLILGVYGEFEVQWRLDHSPGEYIQGRGKSYPALFL